MKKIIILLLILITALFVISTVSANDDDIIIDDNEKTITVTGKAIVYDDTYTDYSKKAQKQIEKYDKYNKKNPTKYTITLSDKQYKKLGTAEKQDKYKSIQINTDQPIIIKKPVIKTNKVKIFSKTYYNEKQFNKALKKFEKRYDSDDYKIKVKTKYKKETDIHGHTFTLPVYSKIIIYQKEYKVLYYKTKKDTVTAFLWVNDYTNYIIDGVYFGALKLGWYGGEIYSNEIYVEPYEDEGGVSSGTSSTPYHF